MGAIPASGSFALGVGETVPVSEYPLPPRPQTLEPFTPLAPEPTIELRAELSDPNRRKDFTVEWPGDNHMTARMNTPGRIRVLVNDVVVIDYSHWFYSVATGITMPYQWTRYGLELSEKQTVKITVIPERITGDWIVTVAPQ